jgi:Zn-dependent protease with chaperone function
LNSILENHQVTLTKDFAPSYKHERGLFLLGTVMSLLVWAALIVGTLGIGLVYISFGFCVYLFLHSALISRIRGTGARVSADQYPQLHKMVRDCAERIGMDSVPDVYLLSGRGILNAFATRFLGRNFVVLYADIVDALEHRPEAARFYIGHEMGHIQRGHLKWMPFLLPLRLVPFLGAAYSRACEYTADRLGHLCCSQPDDSAFALGVLAVGGKRAVSLNMANYVGQVKDSAGFFMSFHEYLSPYPWLAKRLAAVAAYANGQEPVPPRRNALAMLFAMTGGSGVLMAAVGVGIALAVLSTNPGLKEMFSAARPALGQKSLLVDPYQDVQQDAALDAALEEYGPED